MFVQWDIFMNYTQFNAVRTGDYRRVTLSQIPGVFTEIPFGRREKMSPDFIREFRLIGAKYLCEDYGLHATM